MQKGFYKVRIGKEYLSPQDLEKGLFYRLKKGMKIHITPVIQGAKKNGVWQIVVGVVLIAASWYAGGAAGWGYLGAQGYAGATMAFSMGVSLALGGVAQMLTKTPSLGGDIGKGDEQDMNKNSAFSNLENLSPQGRPVPLVYGEILTSGIIISQGVETFNKTEAEGNKTGTGTINTGGSGSGGGQGGSSGGNAGTGGLGDSLGWSDPDGLPNPNVVPAEVWKQAWIEARKRKGGI